MKVINASYQILTPFDERELQRLELAARTCYKSEDKMTEASARKMIKNLIARGHEAMLEHGSFTVKFICDRGVSHELVRHRLASFAQESTRYCNYGHDKFGNGLTFIKPCFWSVEDPNYELWRTAMAVAEDTYLTMLKNGAQPQEARSVLPNSIKTEVVMTANYREWRHFFNLRACRATGPAHPQMEELTVPLLREMTNLLPDVFDDLYSKWLSQQSDGPSY